MTGNRQASKESDSNRHALLERRMLLFAAHVIRKLETVTNLSPKLVDQLTRSASSIGANYAEACNGASKLDFRNKIYIAKKEAAETRFWIDLCIELKGNDEEWNALRTESAELLMILQAIINALRDGSTK